MQHDSVSGMIGINHKHILILFSLLDSFSVYSMFANVQMGVSYMIKIALIAWIECSCDILLALEANMNTIQECLIS